jgi:tetratricopeptide (TPR) repeat protein
MSTQSTQSSPALRRRGWRRPTIARLGGAIALLGLEIVVLPWLMWAYQINRAATLIEQGVSWPAPRSSDTLPSVNDPQQLAQARAALDRAINWRPGHVYAYRLRGQIALAEGRWEEAEAFYAEASRLAPNNPLIVWEQALAHEQRMGLGWVPPATSADLAAQDRELLQLWERAGLSMEQFIDRGEEARGRQQPGEALRWYERANMFAPQAGIPWYYAGLVYESTRQSDQALLAYQQATIRQPDFRDGWYALGQLHMARQEWQEALAAFDEGTHAPTGKVSLPTIYYAIGQLRQYFIEPHDSAGAERAYNQALAAQPPAPAWLQADLYYQRGNALTKQERWAAAVESYRNAIALRPDFAPNHIGLAIALWRLGDISAAQAAGRRAIELAPDSVDGYRLLAIIYETEGDIAQARDFYKHMLALQPDNLQAQQGLKRLEDK